MPKLEDDREALLAENERLRQSLLEAKDTLDAIRNGEVDAVVVAGPDGDQVYTLSGANRGYRTKHKHPCSSYL